MRIIISFIILFISFQSIAQNNWTDKFPIKTTFELGTSEIYEVSEFFKVDNLIFGNRYEVQSIVSFYVLDTSNGGYWISYRVNVNSVTQHKDSSAYIIASLMNEIELLFYAKNGNIKVDSTTYFNTKNRIATKLDSIISQYSYGKKNKKFLEYLQNEIKTEAGLGFLLAPLMLFETYYSSEVYKKFRLSNEGESVNVLYNPLFTGIIEREWKSTSKDSTVKLNYDFTGDPVPSARYYKSIYEPILVANGIKYGKHFFPPEMRYFSSYNFQTRPGESFPSLLYKKNVSEYIFRSVTKIEMKKKT